MPKAAETTTTPAAPRPFDFAALAARAQVDNPDALLLEMIQENQELNRRLRLPRSKVSLEGYRVGCRVWITQRDRIANTPARSAEGLAAKIRFAMKGKSGAPGFMLEVAALREALAWIEPKPVRKPRAKGRAVA